ncbi:MAG: hypothetical protein GY759_13605 [Chloroflexi bacterium]|nr:hypothetical protein [Chloroflexota bacterium]
MIARGILRGGLLGAFLAVAFNVLSVIPICGFAALPLRMLAWALGGYAGGRIAVRAGAGNGGVAAGLGAGILAGVIDGIAYVALAPIRFKLAGDMITSLHLLPEGVITAFNDMGINLMSVDTMGGSLFFSILICGGTWLAAGVLGALGGGIAQALAD